MWLENCETQSATTLGGNAICIDPHWVVDHEGALEGAEGFPSWGPFGSLADASLGCNVVCEEECGWIWVVILWS